MTQHTALLVLETDEDYVRFGIPQDRLSPILVVEPGAVFPVCGEEYVFPFSPVGCKGNLSLLVLFVFQGT